MYTRIKFPSIIPTSFNVVLPSKSVRGFLKIYKIPKGKKIIGKNMTFWVNINANTIITIDREEAIHITSWDTFGDNFDSESPSINSCSICPVYPTKAIEIIRNNSGKVRLGKKNSAKSPAFIFIINQGNTICEIPKMIWLIITRDLKRQ